MQSTSGGHPGDVAEAQTAPNEYLPCAIGGIRCALPFVATPEVLWSIPPTVTLPSSHPAFLGVFAHRLRIFGLVDPLPFLRGEPGTAARAFPRRAPTGRRAPGAGGAATMASADREPHGGVAIVGKDERRIGLALDALGPGVVLAPMAIPSDGRAQPDVPFLPRYIAGMARHTSERPGILILDIEPLLDDLHAALAPWAAHDLADVAGKGSGRP